ncbi:MAG: hypothetical protein MJZ34_13745 [Paludibacteraceae bacterium]|nr:hypothetical protein [Paludibacteraceae bacterium]
MFIYEVEKEALKHIIDNENVSEEDRKQIQDVLKRAEEEIVEWSYDKESVLIALQETYWQDLDNDDADANFKILRKDENFFSRIQDRIKYISDYYTWEEFSEVVCDIFNDMYVMKDNKVIRKEND